MKVNNRCNFPMPQFPYLNITKKQNEIFRNAKQSNFTDKPTAIMDHYH